MRKNLLILLGLIIIGFSCKKKDLVPNNGIYRGVFRTINATTGDTTNSGVTYIALFESQLSFSMVGDSITKIPATHNGTYLVENNSVIQFSTNNTPVPPFHPDHYLDTSYNYTFDNTNFKFWQTINGYILEYDLKRD